MWSSHAEFVFHVFADANALPLDFFRIVQREDAHSVPSNVQGSDQRAAATSLVRTFRLVILGRNGTPRPR